MGRALDGRFSWRRTDGPWAGLSQRPDARRALERPVAEPRAARISLAASAAWSTPASRSLAAQGAPPSPSAASSAAVGSRSRRSRCGRRPPQKILSLRICCARSRRVSRPRRSELRGFPSPASLRGEEKTAPIFSDARLISAERSSCACDLNLSASGVCPRRLSPPEPLVARSQG